MKICILGSTYARNHEDPQVPWLRQTANRLASRGHEVTIAASSYKGSKHHKIDGLRVLRYRYAPAFLETLTHDEGAPAKLKNKALNILAALYIVLGSIQFLIWCFKNKFDVVHVHWPFPHALFVILPKLLLGVTVVTTTHGAGLAMARKSKLIKLVLKFVLKFSDLDMTNSSHTRNELRRLTGVDSEVVHYGSTVEFKESSVALANKDEVRILFSGRLIQRKGIHFLIKAMPKVLEKHNVKLFITGDGNRKKEWQDLTANMNLENNVTFLGFVSNEELARQYAKCDIYCLPAIYDDNNDTEGLGVVLIEALMHSRPVIASAVGGIVDVIKNEQTGLLVKEKDSDAITRAILRLIDNPELARTLGANGFDYAAKAFNWNTIIDNVEYLLEQAVNKKVNAFAREVI